MALAEKVHHSANRTVLTKEDVEQHHTPRGHKPARARPGTQYFFLGRRECAGASGGASAAGSVSAAHRGAEDRAHAVQILDAPVPHAVDSVLDVFRALDSSIAEQVIEVLKVFSPLCPSRAVLREPQVAEQLVEVPTVLAAAAPAAECGANH